MVGDDVELLFLMTSGHLIIGVKALLFLSCGGMFLSLEFHQGRLFSELRSYRYVVIGIIAPMDSQPFCYRDVSVPRVTLTTENNLRENENKICWRSFEKTTQS